MQARDANNNVAENFSGNVSLNASATGGSNFNGGTASASAVAGVASFNALALNNAANGYTVTAASTGLTGGTSNSFNVTARIPRGHQRARERPSRETRSTSRSRRATRTTTSRRTSTGTCRSTPTPPAAAIRASRSARLGERGGRARRPSPALTLRNAANGYTVTASSFGRCTSRREQLLQRHGHAPRGARDRERPRRRLVHTSRFRRATSTTTSRRTSRLRHRLTPRADGRLELRPAARLAGRGGGGRDLQRPGAQQRGERLHGHRDERGAHGRHEQLLQRHRPIPRRHQRDREHASRETRSASRSRRATRTTASRRTSTGTCRSPPTPPAAATRTSRRRPSRRARRPARRPSPRSRCVTRRTATRSRRRARGSTSGVSNSFNVTAHAPRRARDRKRPRRRPVQRHGGGARREQQRRRELHRERVARRERAAGGSNFNAAARPARRDGRGRDLQRAALLNDAANGYTVTASSAGLDRRHEQLLQRHRAIARRGDRDRERPRRRPVQRPGGGPRRASGHAARRELQREPCRSPRTSPPAARASRPRSPQSAAAGIGDLLRAAASERRERLHGHGVEPARSISGDEQLLQRDRRALVVLAIANVRAGDPFNVTVEARDANEQRRRELHRDRLARRERPRGRLGLRRRARPAKRDGRGGDLQRRCSF